MGPFTRIAFWIVILASCLQARPTDKPLTVFDEEDWDIDFIREHVVCESDTTLYTPTNVGDCLTSALDCILRELNGTAKAECDDKHNYIDSQVESLSDLIKQRQGIYPLNNSTECACEGWPQTSLKEFLNAAESAFQLHNNQVNNVD